MAKSKDARYDTERTGSDVSPEVDRMISAQESPGPVSEPDRSRPAMPEALAVYDSVSHRGSRGPVKPTKTNVTRKAK